MPVSSHCPLLLPKSQAALIHFLSLGLAVLCISHECNHTICNLLWLVSFTQIMFLWLICVVSCMGTSLLMAVWVSTVWMDMFCLHAQPLAGTLLGGSHFLPLMGNAAVNIGVQVCVWTDAFVSLGYTPRTGITGPFGLQILSSAVWEFISCSWYCPLTHRRFDFRRSPIYVLFLSLLMLFVFKKSLSKPR